MEDARRTLFAPWVFSLILAVTACGTATQPASPPTRTSDSTSAKPPAQDGPQVIHTQDGGRMEGTLHAGQRTGEWTAYFADGGIRSRANYIDGLEQGATEVFHPNGMSYYKGQYIRGKPTGEWVFFDTKGAEVKRVHYDSTGVLVP